MVEGVPSQLKLPTMSLAEVTALSTTVLERTWPQHIAEMKPEQIAALSNDQIKALSLWLSCPLPTC